MEKLTRPELVKQSLKIALEYKEQDIKIPGILETLAQHIFSHWRENGSVLTALISDIELLDRARHTAEQLLILIPDAPTQRQCAAIDCEKLIEYYSRALYCSPRCQRRVNMRKYRARKKKED